MPRRIINNTLLLTLIVLLAGTSFVHGAGQTDYILLSDPVSENAHHLTSKGSEIQRCGGMVGFRDEHYACRVTPAVVQETRNLALNSTKTGFPNPSASSVDTCYNIWGPIDGVNEGGEFSWTNTADETKASWWQLDFGKSVQVDRVVVKTLASYPLKDFDLLRWNEDLKDWDTEKPIAKVRGNTNAAITVDHLNLATSKLRALCLNGPDYQAMYRRITEFEVYPPVPTLPSVQPKSFSYQIKIPAKGKWTLEVQEVNDDNHNGDRTKYQILIDGKPVYQRDYADLGPGLMTYFIDLDSTGKRTATITFKDTSGYGIRIRSLRAYENFDKYCIENRYMLPMYICPRIYSLSKEQQGSDPKGYEAWTEVFRKEGAADILGVVVVLPFTTKDADWMRARIKELGELSVVKKIPIVLQYTSTWADTPLQVPDGAGGKFGDIQYQQIGYSEFDNYDDPGLKEYMDSCKQGWYNIHYGLTTPNHWANTPWITMNHPRLNSFRQKRLMESITQLNAVIKEMENKGSIGNLLGIIGDDEPIYWTKIVDLFDDGYSQVNKGARRTDLTLDFNWYTVQDAAKDGVVLDPTDGLDMKERKWLHNNITRYNRLMMGTILKSLCRPAIGVKDDYRLNLYVYAMEDPGFPLSDPYHPLWETGSFSEVSVGIEAMGSKYFPRARELARIANSDFECADPTLDTVKSWLPVIQDYYENGCRFVHFCNPGIAENWGPVARFIAKPTPDMDRKRMESLLISWRRDTENVLARTKITRANNSSITKARKLLALGRYRDAYETALTADSVK